MVRYKVDNFVAKGHLALCTEEELNEYIQKLIMRLSDENKELRRKAAEALAEYVSAGLVPADITPHPAAVLVETSLTGRSRDGVTSALMALAVMGEGRVWPVRFLLSSKEVTWISGHRNKKLTRLRDIAAVSISKADAPRFDAGKGEYRANTSPFDSDKRVVEISGPMDARLKVAKLILEDLSTYQEDQCQNQDDLSSKVGEDNIEQLIGSLEDEDSHKEASSSSSSPSLSDLTMKVLLPAQQYDAMIDNEWSGSEFTLDSIIEEAGVKVQITQNSQNQVFDEQEDQGYTDEYEEDEIILKLYSRNDRLFKIVRGKVNIEVDREVVEILGEGQCFGEPGVPTQYTARAASNCQILATIPPDPEDVYPFHLATCVGNWNKCFAALEILHSALEQDPQGKAPVVVEHAGRAIARLMGQRDRAIRVEAAETLAKLGSCVSPDMAAALAKELNDEESVLVWRFVKCIGKLGEAAASSAGAVAQCLTHEDPHVRRESAKTLRLMGPDAAQYASKQLAFALRPFSEHDPKKPWKGPHQDVREFAVLALMAFGESAVEFGAPALAKILITDQYDDSLRFAAARALRAMGPEAAELSLRQLARALDDPDELVREAAKEALVAMNCHDALRGSLFVGSGRSIVSAATPGKALKTAEPVKAVPVEFIFESADYDKVDHAAFKTAVFDALAGLGLETSVRDSLTISLKKGSVVAKLDGPAEALNRVRALPFVDDTITIRMGLKRYEGRLCAPAPTRKFRGAKKRPAESESAAGHGPLGSPERSSRMAECLERPETRQGREGSPIKRGQEL